MTALDLDRLVDLERRGWDALCASTGGVFYQELMTPGAVMILVNGMVLDRDAVAASLNDSPPWTSYELSQERAIELGADVTALVYRGSASRDGQAEPFVALMCSVYRIVDGRPRLSLHQQTTTTH